MSLMMDFLLDSQYPPLHSAVAGGNIDMIKTLMRLECPVDLEDTYGVSVDKRE